jgi:hypothetical protein
MNPTTTPAASGDGSQLPPSLRVAAQNLYTWTQCLPVIRALNELNIPVMVLKSLPQVEELYGNAAGRSSGDVDLLVPGSRALEAITCIQGMGWSFDRPIRFRTAVVVYGQERASQIEGWHFLSPDGAAPVIIDLHSDTARLWYKPAIDPGVWANSLQVHQDEVYFHLMCPEDRLVMLCCHSVRENLRKRTLSDVAMAIENAPLDWRRVANRARSCGLETTVHVICETAVLATAHASTAAWADVPGLQSSWYRSRLVTFLAQRPPEGFGLLAGYGVRFLLADRWQHRVTLLKDMFIPTRVEVAQAYLDHVPTVRDYWMLLPRALTKRLRHVLHCRMP